MKTKVAWQEDRLACVCECVCVAMGWKLKGMQRVWWDCICSQA